MDSFTINMRNHTQAMKGRSALSRLGIRSAVERTHGRNGCSFRLRVFGGNRRQICALLNRAGVPCDLS